MIKIDLTDNIKGLLLAKYEWYESNLLASLQHQGYQNLTANQVRVFGQLKGQSKNISDLAKQLGVSRQAAQKTVSSLVDYGLLELKPCTENKSAKVVHITNKGHDMRKVAGEAMGNIEEKIRLKIGEEPFALLKTALSCDWD